MNVRMWMLGFFGLTLASSLTAQEDRLKSSPWPNVVGLQLVAVEEGDGLGYAAYYSRDLSLRDRIYLQLEWQEFKESDRWTDGGWTYRTHSSIDAREIEIGYFRRLTPPDKPWGLHLGPAIGVAFDEGSFSSRATEDGTGLDEGGLDDDGPGGAGEEGTGERDDPVGEKAADGSVAESGDIELDPGICLYAVAMADYVFANHVGAMAMFSYGYSFEQDGKFKHSTSDRGSQSFTLDDDFFWNLAVGVTYEF